MLKCRPEDVVPGAGIAWQGIAKVIFEYRRWIFKQVWKAAYVPGQRCAYLSNDRSGSGLVLVGGVVKAVARGEGEA